MLKFLEQFYQVYSSFSRNPLYIFGESYGGKYAPAVAYAIHLANGSGGTNINLKGIGLGDGLIDPESQMQGYAELAYQFSLADINEVETIRTYERNLNSAIRSKDFLKAFDIFDEFLNGDFYPYPTYFYNITGNSNYFNLNDPDYPPNPYGSFLRLPSVRDALHVGDIPCSSVCCRNSHSIRSRLQWNCRISLESGCDGLRQALG